MSDNDDIKEKKELQNNNKDNNQEEVINWREQCEKGNFMPAIVMLEQKRINIDDVVNPQNGNTILHYAASFGFYNVIRALIEIYHADINKQNLLGFTPLLYIVSNTDGNIFNFQYIAKVKDIKFDILDNNGLSLLVHSIITNFHYPFLYFSSLGLINDQKKDKFSNPLIYFAIVNNNKFALSYLLSNKKFSINDTYYNNTSILSDILITNKNISITKFLVKYFNEEIKLSSIRTCKKSLLNFPFYNIFNYELLNTLYFYKTGNYCRFFLALLKPFSPKFNIIPNQILLEDKLVNSAIGYKYKLLNLKYMIYDLILPKISKGKKILLFLLYICILYLGTKRTLIKKFFNEDEEINLFSVIYRVISILILYIWFIVMCNSNGKVINNGSDIESEVANIIQNGNAINLPYIGEICAPCGTRKKLDETHCYRCNGCHKNKFFHSNLFQICISKYNIKRYFFYLILKINFYLLCLFNCLENNETNKSLLAFFYMFRYKTELINFFLELFIGFLLFKEIGHFLALILSLTVKTPYEYIYRYHKKVYPYTLKEKNENNMILQSPEINDYISLPKAIQNIFANIC